MMYSHPSSVRLWRTVHTAQGPWNMNDGISHPNKLAYPSYVGFFGSAEDPSTSFKFYFYSCPFLSLVFMTILTIYCLGELQIARPGHSICFH